MEENPLLPFTVAMTVGLTLVVLARAALDLWRHNHGRRNRPDSRH